MTAGQRSMGVVARLWGTAERLAGRFGISPRLLRFLVVGGSGVVVNLGVMAVMLLLLPDGRLRPHIASITGIAVSIFTNFLLNDIWTWGDRPKGGVLHWFSRLAKFYLVSSAAALIQYGVFYLLFELVGFDNLLGEKAGSLVSQCIGILLALVINYLVNNYWTFREGAR
ncbi:MAG: GtrA family protein [Bradymonadales bacterium]|nr:GtrA family protein [Bradymonadales bacterium]